VRVGVAGLVALAAHITACDAALPPSGWPPPSGPMPADDPQVARQAAVGRLLFYDPILSADGETACATCHSEIWGMGDGLPRSIGLFGGTLAGPGRDGPNVLARNAPSLWNVAFRQELFWDGRVASLEELALVPLQAPDELGLAPLEAARRISQIPEYVTLFGAAFPAEPEPISPTTLARALAAFQRMLVSDRALWDAWMDGDPRAMTPEMQRGWEVFRDAGCDGCHVPPTFMSARFLRRDPTSQDPGREAVSGAPQDRGAFRVPSLRNARETGPYFHDGSAPTLEAAIRRELAVDGVALADADVDALARFLGRALIDRSREPDRPEVVPSGLPVPEDGFRIPR